MSASELFAKYIIEEIFTDDKRGDYVCPIVDDAFMGHVAKRLGMTKESLVDNVRDLFWHNRYYNFNINAIIALVAIQLYAVSICESRGEYTSNAYRPRLEEILRIDRLNIDKWMESYQDNIWYRFYQWCKANGFKIAECQPRSFANRYIQYPLKLSRFSFNKEDHKSFGWVFHSYSLKPNDDISYDDFWGLQLFSVVDFGIAPHAKRVITNVERELSDNTIIKRQIYNSFNTWNGEYKDLNIKGAGKNNGGVNRYEVHLSMRQSNFEICIENTQSNNMQSISIDSNLKSTLSKFYRYRKGRNNIILFQKNQDYDDYWDETMFVRSKDEAALIVTTGAVYELFTRRFNVMYSQGDIRIYEISYKDYTRQFYTQAIPVYELFGGLKISKNTYLKGGAPILRILKDGGFWMDRVHYDGEVGDRVLDFDTGEHWIKFPDKNKESITIVDQEMKLRDWDVGYSKWIIDRKEQRWQPISHINGIIGVDFSAYSQIETRRTSLKDWIMTQNGAKINSNNISVKLSKNYE